MSRLRSNRQSIVLRFLQVAVFLCAVTSLGRASTLASAVVGSCKPGKQFSTIQAAVNAVSAGGTVYVCAGQYPEQVLVSNSVSIKGYPSGTAGSSVIVAPTGGLVPIGSGYYAQMLVQATGPVNLSNLVIDGTGNSCPVSWYGLVFGANAQGSADGIVVRNLGTGSCSTVGIDLAAGSAVSIKNSVIHDSLSGIEANGAANLEVSSTTIQSCYSAVGIGSMKGPVAIKNNRILNVGVRLDPNNGVGIFVGGNPSSSTTISGNTIQTGLSGQGGGIEVTQATGVSITDNWIVGFYEGIGLTEAQNTTVQRNVLTEDTRAISVGDNGLTGNNVATHNTINEASCGVNTTTNSYGDTLTPNTLLNVDNGLCI